MIDKRTKRLIELMRKHDLEPPVVAKLLGRTPKTVYMWRIMGGKTRRPIPGHMLELLERILAA